nr:RNA-binding protein 43 isoform X1 [Pogona vitticeps]
MQCARLFFFRFQGKHVGETKANIDSSRLPGKDLRSEDCAVMATAQAAKSERTIVVCGIPDGLLNDDIMADILMIHFQKAKNKGGDVEDVAYPTATKGVAYVTFEDKREENLNLSSVAENVLQKGEHRLEDKRLYKGYPLKVSPCGQSVFSCVTCILNLSILGEKHNLEDLVEELKKNLPDLSFGPFLPGGHIHVQGPFSAVCTLQNKLVLKAKHSVSEQNDRKKERVPSPRPNVRPGRSGFSSEPRENFISDTSEEILTVVVDTDIYHYMKTFKNKLYQRALEKYCVNTSTSTDGDVTTIYLYRDSTKKGPSPVEDAKNTMESLFAELHGSLRKERLSQKGLTRIEKREYEWACEVVGVLFPKVLIVPYSTHIDIIGFSSDIYEFSRQVNKMAGNSHKEPQK